MTSTTFTPKVDRPAQTPHTRSSWKRGGLIVLGVALVAALGFSTIMVLGGDEPAVTTIPATVLGDRDAAFIRSAELYEDYLAAQAKADATGTQAGSGSVEFDTPAVDRDEAFRQSAERLRQSAAAKGQ